MCLKVLTLVVEAVDPVDGCALVVAAQQEEVLRILDLVGQQQANRLQGLLPCTSQQPWASIKGDHNQLADPDHFGSGSFRIRIWTRSRMQSLKKENCKRESILC